jgi:hypothetical protein
MFITYHKDSMSIRKKSNDGVYLQCTSGSRRPGSAAAGTGVDNPLKMACTYGGTSRLFYMIGKTNGAAIDDTVRLV